MNRRFWIKKELQTRPAREQQRLAAMAARILYFKRLKALQVELLEKGGK